MPFEFFGVLGVCRSTCGSQSRITELTKGHLQLPKLVDKPELLCIPSAWPPKGDPIPEACRVKEQNHLSGAPMRHIQSRHRYSYSRPKRRFWRVRFVSAHLRLSAVLRASLKGAETKRTLQKRPFGRPLPPHDAFSALLVHPQLNPPSGADLWSRETGESPNVDAKIPGLATASATYRMEKPRNPDNGRKIGKK